MTLIFAENMRGLLKWKSELWSNRKPIILLRNKDGEFYEMKIGKKLNDNNAELCSAKNKDKSAIRERFIRKRLIRALKNQILKYMIVINNDVCYDKLD